MNGGEAPETGDAVCEEYLGSSRFATFAITAVALLALMFVALMRLAGEADDSTALWFLDPFLTITFLTGMWLNRRYRLRDRVRLSARAALFVFILLSWLAGMLLELTLREGDGSYGGLHPETVSSFVLAQGFYLPLAVLGALVIRHFRFRLQDAYLAGGFVAAYEALTLGLPMMLQIGPLAAVVLAAYYFTVYANLLAWPLVFVDERLLWSKKRRPIRPWYRPLAGAVLCVICCAAFVGWAWIIRIEQW